MQSIKQLVLELAAMAGFDASETTITAAGARAGAFRITATISAKIQEAMKWHKYPTTHLSR